MTTELRVLQQILRNRGRASVQSITNRLDFGSEYIRYLCLELLKKGLVKKRKERDWYEITRRGQGEIKKPKKIRKKPEKVRLKRSKKSRRRLAKKKK